MVVPQNRRGFLKLIRNVAVAAGISTPVIASPIIQSTENPKGLPVVKFDEHNELIVNDLVFDLQYEDIQNELVNTFFSYVDGHAFPEYTFVKVWVSTDIPVVVTPYKYLGHKLVSGEMILCRRTVSHRHMHLHKHYALLCSKNTKQVKCGVYFKNVESRIS